MPAAVEAKLRIARDDDAGGDKAPVVARSVLQHREHAPDIESVGVDVFLRRRFLHHHRRLGVAHRARDELAQAAELDAESRLAIGLA